MYWLRILSAFLVLHQVDGRQILINAEYIITLTPTEEAAGISKRNKLVAPGARCVVVLSNNRYYGVLEDCAAVRNLMEAKLPRLPVP